LRNNPKTKIEIYRIDVALSVQFHAEVPLLAFAGLVHLGITRFH